MKLYGEGDSVNATVQPLIFAIVVGVFVWQALTGVAIIDQTLTMNMEWIGAALLAFKVLLVLEAAFIASVLGIFVATWIRLNT